MSASEGKRPLETSFVRLEQFWLFEARNNFYIVGFDNSQTFFRLLKINREIANPRDLSEIVREDPLTYSAEEITDILDMISEGNKASGGLVKLCTACGIVGFIKFLNGYYLTMITQKKEVGCIAGNYIYTIKATEMFPIRPKEETESNALRYLWKKLNKKLSQTGSEVAENRYLGLFQFIDMTKDFFFSYSYDLTHSMQFNYITTKDGRASTPLNMFEWNHYQIHNLRGVLGEASSMLWTTPIIHGSYQQKRFTFFGKNMDLILLARRSRHYAGTRYLKRGINVHGKVANDVEVEQIVQYDSGADLKFCSYIQMRGSIPTFWAQETSLTMPKPPIMLSRTDPDYLATQEHFTDMLRRYSSPILVLDLVKQHEKRARESLVGREFRQAIEIINESIPRQHQVRYIALDYSKITSISKGKLSKAKTTGGGFFRTPTKERAMEAVGQEWALMEKSLALSNGSTTQGPPAPPGAPGAGAVGTPPSQHKTLAGAPSTPKGASNRPQLPSTPSSSTGATFASLDEARKAIDADPMVPNIYHYDNHAQHSTNQFPSALGDIAEINALESRIDVLKELEDIASLTLSETGFFCNTTQFVGRLEKNLPQRCLTAADKLGLFLQSGVLRTNCIDCLDRTNGGQFAVAMRFLSFAFRALGVSDDHTLDISKDPVLQSLMEMYGEMGDKIALQYGGSEAHKKVIAGKSVQSQSSSKQSELLTSIKRYYSNAFTDMMKQDAMNLFLGCFNPMECPLQLWDLETDYALHNLDLQPPLPKNYRVMFEEIVRDSDKLRHATLRAKIESTLKRVIVDGSGAALGGDAVATVSEEDSGSDKVLTRVTSIAMLPCTTEADHRRNKEAFDQLLHLYFIRPLANQAEGQQKLKHKGFVNSITRQLARLERRRLMRLIAYRKVAVASQDWWKSAIQDHLQHLFLEDNAEIKALNSTLNASTLKTLSYYERFHQPRTLTEFDTLLAQDFFNPLTGAEAVTTGMDASGRYLSVGDFQRLDEGGEGRQRKDSDDPTQPAINSLMAFFFSPPTPPSSVAHAHEGSSAVTTIQKHNQKEKDNNHDLVLSFSQDHLSPNPNNNITTRPPALSVGSMTDRSSFLLPQHRTSFVVNDEKTAAIARDVIASGGGGFGAGSGNSNSNNSNNNGFGITKYVREMGQKARNIVEGFILRKEDESSLAGPSDTRAKQKRALTRLHDSGNRNAPITSLYHYIPKISLMLYNQYSDVYDNNLLLMETKSQDSHIEDEYRSLLKDSIIDQNDVKRMEQLANDGYISAEVQRGVFAGMSQMSSAVLAVSLLFISLVNIERELQQFGDHVEQAAERSRAKYMSMDSEAVSSSKLAVSKALEGINSASAASLATTSAGGKKVSVRSAFTTRARAFTNYASGGQNAAPYPSSIKGVMTTVTQKTTSLEMTTSLNERIAQCLSRVRVASGLEAEFRKYVNNYIFQQYNYMKEITFERMARRISTMTSEKTMMQYAAQFDHDLVAAEWDDVVYVARESPSYTSFREMHSLQESLASRKKLISEKRVEEVRRRRIAAGEIAEEKDKTNVVQTHSSPKVAIRKRTKRKISPPGEKQDVANSKAEAVSSGVSSAPDASINGKLKVSEETFTSQLGLHLEGLWEDLRQDFSLPLVGQDTLKEYESFPFYSSFGGGSTNASSSEPSASSPFTALSGMHGDYLMGTSSHFVQPEVRGFNQLAPDLYSRSTNPHLHMNEIGAMRFQQVISRS